MENNKQRDKKSQSDKFKAAARELETDDDEKRFDEKLGKVAKAQKPKGSSTSDGGG